MRILIAASDKAELSAFPDSYGRVITGVGPVLAAANTSLAISSFRPDVVISVGTAGSAGSLAVGDIVSFGSVVFPDADLTAYGLKRGTTLLPDHRKLSSISLDPSSHYVLSSSSAFASASAAGVDAFDMEGYGVAVAALCGSVPCLAVKAITDTAGVRTEMKDYLKLRRSLVQMLPTKVSEVIGALF